MPATPNERVQFLVRSPASLKARVEEYARNLGINTNAAVIILLNEGLRAGNRLDQDL